MNVAGKVLLVFFEAGLNKVLEYKQSSRSDIALCVIEPFSKNHVWLSYGLVKLVCGCAALLAKTFF